jgi:hypothetical protein
MEPEEQGFICDCPWTIAPTQATEMASAPQAVLQKLVDWDERYPRNQYRIVEYGAVQASEKELDVICEEAHKVLAAPSLAGTQPTPTLEFLTFFAKWWADMDLAKLRESMNDPIWADGKHCGDCTKQPATCNRCVLEDIEKQAAEFAKYLPGAAQGTPQVEEIARAIATVVALDVCNLTFERLEYFVPLIANELRKHLVGAPAQPGHKHIWLPSSKGKGYSCGVCDKEKI